MEELIIIDTGSQIKNAFGVRPDLQHEDIIILPIQKF